MDGEAPSHVLLVCYPGQGHVNPMLRLGKKLASKGLFVTLLTAKHFGEQLIKAGTVFDKPTPVVGNNNIGSITFAFFEDGIKEFDPNNMDFDRFNSVLALSGKASVAEMIKTYADQNRPVSCLIGNPFLPWVCDIAYEFGIPCAILWVQSCALFSIYYHHFHKSVPFPSETEPDIDVQFPSFPLLKHDEIPSFLLPNDIYGFLGKTILSQFSNLSIPFCILMDTFEELEREIIESMSKICRVKPIGPLFKNPKKELEVEISGDCLKADDCMEWLNTKPPKSVIYIAFGSVVHLTQEQVDEIAYGLCNSGFSFLWVLKPPPEFLGWKSHVLPDGVLEKAGERGMVVKWSKQEQVLSHSATACFVTHCGWNSSMEALSLGVPIVAFPQWGDQLTNAKFLVDEFGIGLRLSRGVSENKLVLRDEIEKCLFEAMVGPKAEEMRRNALKWKKTAEDAVADGGSSDHNIQEFVDKIKKGLV